MWKGLKRGLVSPVGTPDEDEDDKDVVAACVLEVLPSAPNSSDEVEFLNSAGSSPNSYVI